MVLVIRNFITFLLFIILFKFCLKKLKNSFLLNFKKFINFFVKLKSYPSYQNPLKSPIKKKCANNMEEKQKTRKSLWVRSCKNGSSKNIAIEHSLQQWLVIEKETSWKKYKVSSMTSTSLTEYNTKCVPDEIWIKFKEGKKILSDIKI